MAGWMIGATIANLMHSGRMERRKRKDMKSADAKMKKEEEKEEELLGMQEAAERNKNRVAEKKKRETGSGVRSTMLSSRGTLG